MTKLLDSLENIYKVGGCVRDQLIGVEPNDIDYVAVGYTEEQMLLLGFKKVGISFPVFLDPDTNCEVALARTEKSTGDGYNDFTVSTEGVTLEEDLWRRDLTINAIAIDKNGNIIDPHNGMVDLEKKILRHRSDAFKEDPLRVLRLARLRAKLGYEWRIASETKLLVEGMKKALYSLQPDRVYAEVSKAMKLPNAYLFFTTLDALNVLDIVFPNIAKMKNYREDSLWHMEPNVFEHTMSMLRQAAKEPEIVKWCILYHDIAKPYCRLKYGSGFGHDDKELAEPLIDIKLPNKIKYVVLFHIDNHQRIFKIFEEMTLGKCASTLESFGKNQDLFATVLAVSYYDNVGATQMKPDLEYCLHVLQGLSVMFKKICEYSPKDFIEAHQRLHDRKPTGIEIKDHIHRENCRIVKDVLNQFEAKNKR